MVLDHTDGIELSSSDAEAHFDACMALARLGEGLFSLYRIVGELERRAQIAATAENVQIAVFGGILDGLPTGFLSCAFQWYAVSACNYAQLVGWLGSQNPKAAKEYVTRVMPRVSRFRNKVAAHFAITDPRRDNEADLAASVMTHVIYVHGRLCGSALTPVVVRGENEIVVSRDLSWSLTLAHERLIPRYWPDGSPKAHQTMKVPPGVSKLNVSWADLLGEGT